MDYQSTSKEEPAMFFSIVQPCCWQQQVTSTRPVMYSRFTLVHNVQIWGLRAVLLSTTREQHLSRLSKQMSCSSFQHESRRTSVLMTGLLCRMLLLCLLVGGRIVSSEERLEKNGGPRDTSYPYNNQIESVSCFGRSPEAWWMCENVEIKTQNDIRSRWSSTSVYFLVKSRVWEHVESKPDDTLDKSVDWLDHYDQVRGPTSPH